MNEFEKVRAFGQSFWYDNIQRQLITSGELERMISSGEIQGVTSNPSIFNNAIAKSSDYDDAIMAMTLSGWSPEKIFDRLAIEDITQAADLFREIYVGTDRWDGYVSLEVNPLLAMDTESTIEEARRLWHQVERPNLMIKIPATMAGLPAITQTIADGININVTLIFSLERYVQVIDAYLAGLEMRRANGLALDSVFSVASFFVSRVDTRIDERLQSMVDSKQVAPEEVAHLFGATAIANVRLAYQTYEDQFSSPRFRSLYNAGAVPQRPLWASTSTKNPAYPDLMYVSDLIGKDTINTLPPITLDAFRDHGVAMPTLPGKSGRAQEIFSDLIRTGVDLDTIFSDLESEGVQAFTEAYRSLIASIQEKSRNVQEAVSAISGNIQARMNALEQEKFLERLHHHDVSLWAGKDQPVGEISNRLGWLRLPKASMSLVGSIQAFIKECLSDGYQYYLLLGMGGSSLAPEVIAEIFQKFNVYDDAIKFSILDSTDPEQVSAIESEFPPAATIFIVSSKSGSTSEVTAMMEHFWQIVTEAGTTIPGRQFIAITDPGSSLEKIAIDREFRAIFHGDPDVGGRYSALSAFGLVPSSVVGVDLNKFLKIASGMAFQHEPRVPAERAPGVVLGAVIAEAALAGKDKLTLIADPELASFGSWLEQLIAESSGKQAKGIVPVDLEPQLQPDQYSNDRLFIYYSSAHNRVDFMKSLIKAGHPVVNILVNDPYQLAGEFYRWEIAIAAATHILGVNGFDQPDVQDSKTRTALKINEYLENGKIQQAPPIWSSSSALAFGNKIAPIRQEDTLSEVLEHFLNQSNQGDYIAINAYLPRLPVRFHQLQEFRKRINRIANRPTTLGFGPRFLHSTGQLHKGGPPSGLFIQITREVDSNLKPIPNFGVSFAVLQAAQALGDYEALVARDRRVLRIHLLTSDFSCLFS